MVNFIYKCFLILKDAYHIHEYDIWYVKEHINKNWAFKLPRYRKCIKCNKIEKRYGDFWVETKVSLPLEKITTETEIERLTKINNIINETSL